jgi:hypothetical protein
VGDYLVRSRLARTLDWQDAKVQGMWQLPNARLKRIFFFFFVSHHGKPCDARGKGVSGSKTKPL